MTELEEEVVRVKNYYQKRIKELEDKYKFHAPSSSIPESAQTDDRIRKLEATIEEMTCDRDMLVQRLHAGQKKIIALETELK